MNERLDWQRISQRLADNRRTGDSGFQLDDGRMQQRLRERAARLACRKTDPTPSAPTERLIVFVVGQQRFALELDRVARVSRPGTIVPVPGGPRGLWGVGNLDGQVCSVLDLTGLLSLSAGPAPRKGLASETSFQSQDVDDRTQCSQQTCGGSVLLLKGDGYLLGVSVGHVEQICTCHQEELTPSQDEANEQVSRYVKTMTHDGTIVLNADVLLQHAGREPGDRGSGSCAPLPSTPEGLPLAGPPMNRT